MRKLIILSAAVAAVAAAFVVTACSGKKNAETAGTDIDSTRTTVKHPEWSRNAVIYEVNMRQYSDEGTFKAFEAQLPRLKELGVDILWFMPIHPISATDRKGSLGSYYAVHDYKAVNPEYGTLDEFKALVKKMHEMGFKVMLDWVPNHTGTDNVWVDQHPDWYATDSTGNKFGPYDWTDVYKLDYSNPEMRAAMIDALQFWLKDVGIDGFRCDVAFEVPVDFWDEARKELQITKPDLFMLAEASYPPLARNAFDMSYNWPMKDLFSAIAATAGQYSYVADGKTAPQTFPVHHATAIDSLLADQAREYPKDSYMMNMITNHDLNSWEGTEFERLGNLTSAFAVLSYTLPGMPLIYTGQETGLNRALQFFEKDKAPQWEPRNDFFTFYQKLNELKHSKKALRAGDEGAPMMRYPTASDDLYIFARGEGDDMVLVMTNLGAEAADVAYAADAPAVTEAVDFFTGKKEALPTRLEPGEYHVYTAR